LEPAILKKQLLEACKRYVDSRIHTARESMQYAQEAANEESKSSVGDKYETGRAIMQIERDKAAEQLDEAIKLKNTVDGINLDASTEKVVLGSLIWTNTKNIFIAIGIGRLMLDEKEFLVVAPTSPLGRTLMGKKVKDQLTFNNEVLTISQIV
jgi:hypothetical protein